MSSSFLLFRSSRGFSLVELAVVLAITGVLGLAAWKLIPALRPVAEGNSTQRTLLEAQQALEGFVVTSYRLPCPDTDGDGLENCGSTASVGKLPWRTLGLSSGQNLRYGVYRNSSAAIDKDADLATLKDRYAPLLPPGNASLLKNGLDFCWALRNATAAPAGLSAGGVPVAYALAHPGGNGTFEGANASPNGFEMAAQPVSATYDDQVLTAGLAELSGRLSCPRRLGEVQGAARSAFAAYDLGRNAALYEDFRTFALKVNNNNLEFAKYTLVLAGADMANAVATGVTTVAVAAVSKGLTAGTAAGVAAAIAAAQIGLYTFAALVVTSTLSRDKAITRQTAATNFRVQSYANRDTALQAAQDADKKGLTP